MVKLNFVWGFVVGLVVLLLLALNTFFNDSKGVTILWAGTSYDIIAGCIYFLYVVEDKDEHDNPTMSWSRVAMIPVAMSGWITPFLLTHCAGLCK